VKKVFSIFHEVNLLQKEISLLLRETFFFEHLWGCLLQLIVGSLNLFDVDLLLLNWRSKFLKDKNLPHSSRWTNRAWFIAVAYSLHQENKRSCATTSFEGTW
jgi:hypothetical protein